MKSIATILALAATQAHASNVTRACLEPTVEQNFDLNSYLGLWYEARRDVECRYEEGVCNTASYSLRDDGDIRVRNNQYVDGEWGGGTGKAFVVDPSKDEGYLKVKFVPFVPAGDYKVLGTDYDNYTVIYGCTGLANLYNIEYVWILTRDQNPSDDVIDQALDVVRTVTPEYDIDALAYTAQGDGALPDGGACPYETAPQLEHTDEIGWFNLATQ